ncbi:calcium homeostasis modulator protein 6-like [Talpa occidentalis]|uniref:calcium homeostasis modulator protein 6-like n=1 Tax=Talpa occidentalis TaxID=50954 RepID=UPI00188F4D01|nr:calcium homeostasis modulator protein 6-like [Talpa occidentalis]
MEKFKEVQDLKFKYRSALIYGLVTLLTASGESIFSSKVFQCPCSTTWNLPYGLVFLLVPALALFLMGYLMRANFWRVLTGCCKLGLPVSSGTCLQKTIFCCHVSLATALAPLTWVAVALLQGTFFECASSGSVYIVQHLCSKLYANGTYDYGNCTDQLPLVPCKKAKVAKVQDLLQELKAFSQVSGWVLTALVIIIILISISFARCYSPVSFQQLIFWKIYSKEEQKFFNSEARACATKLAKKNAKSFFESSSEKENTSMGKEEHKSSSAEVYIPSTEDWQQISSLYTYSPNYYSMLHKYVNKKGKSPNSRASQRNQSYPLDFVDEPFLSATDTL